MNKIKVIDLLNMISKGEEVPLIKYRDKILHWNEEKDRFEDKDGMNTLYEMDFSELNDEVEVIEEDKKIRKITLLGEEVKLGLVSNWLKDSTNNEEKIASCIECNAMKINEIIDYINGGTNGE